MRPEGFKNPYGEPDEKGRTTPLSRVYEAGADAYEEGLIKDKIIEIVDGKIQMCCPPDCMGMA